LSAALSRAGVATSRDRSRYRADHFAGVSSEDDRMPVRICGRHSLWIDPFPPSHGDSGRPAVQKNTFPMIANTRGGQGHTLGCAHDRRGRRKGGYCQTHARFRFRCAGDRTRIPRRLLSPRLRCPTLGRCLADPCIPKGNLSRASGRRKKISTW